MPQPSSASVHALPVEAIRDGNHRRQSRGDFLAASIVEMIPPGLPPGERRGAIRGCLDALEAVHRSSGAAVPAWLARARRLHLGE